MWPSISGSNANESSKNLEKYDKLLGFLYSDCLESMSCLKKVYHYDLIKGNFASYFYVLLFVDEESFSDFSLYR